MTRKTKSIDVGLSENFKLPPAKLHPCKGITAFWDQAAEDCKRVFDEHPGDLEENNQHNSPHVTIPNF